MRSAVESCVRAGSVVLGVALGVALALEAPLRNRLFDGSWVLYVAMLAAMPAMLALSLAWGYAMALNRVAVYGRLYASDGIGRLAGAGMLAALGVRSTGLYGIALAAGPVFSLALNHRRLPRPPGRRPNRSDAAKVGRALGHQIATSVLGIAMLSSGPIVVKALAANQRPGDAGRFLNALTVSRAPLLLAPPALTLLVPRLTILVAERRLSELVRRIRRLLLGHLIVSLVLVGAAAALGPTVIRVVYGADYVVPSLDFVLLVTAAMCFLGGQVVGQALLALHAEGRMNVAYVLGAASMAGVIVGTDDLLRRVEMGFLLGTSVTFACLVTMLAAACRRERIADGAHSASIDLSAPELARSIT